MNIWKHDKYKKAWNQSLESKTVDRFCLHMLVSELERTAISTNLYFTKITLDMKQDSNLYSPSLFLMNCWEINLAEGTIKVRFSFSEMKLLC